MQLVVTILSLWTIVQTFCGRLAAVELFSLSTHSEKSWMGWVWGAESTVSIVDRSPPLSYVSRPGKLLAHSMYADVSNSSIWI